MSEDEEVAYHGGGRRSRGNAAVIVPPHDSDDGEEGDDSFGELVQRYTRPRGRRQAAASSGDSPDSLPMGLVRRYSQISNIPTPNSVYTPWEEGQQTSLMLVPTPIVVIPGLVFPLLFRDDQNTGLHFAMLKSLLDSDEPNVFGAVHLPTEDDLLGETRWDCGVTVQILDIIEENQSKLEIKCMGRQRFNVESEELASRHMRATVRILEDQKQPRLLDPAGRVKDSFKYSSLPVWQHKLRDVFSIQNSIKREIRAGCPGVDPDTAPTEPIMFSFWLIATMPFSFHERNSMLRENNLIVRLRKQLRHMRKLNEYDYCCVACGGTCPVVNCKDIMSMAQSGPFYHLKPEGMLDETILCTTVNLETAYAYGTPSARNSINGYGRQLLGCKTCMTDLGWRFTAVSEDVVPRSFYGLKRRLLFIESRTSFHISDSE